jgi:sugar/nucleoside kinase (ribokinase family)
VDVVALGNMCVDVLLPPCSIPPPGELKSEVTLAVLTADAPNESYWEVGGNCNFLIAASRMGLRAAGPYYSLPIFNSTCSPFLSPCV